MMMNYGQKERKKGYRFELGEVVLGGGEEWATDGEKLFSGACLPLRVHGEKERRPRQQVGGGVLPREEERLALLHYVVRRHVISGVDHQPQQVLRRRSRRRKSRSPPRLDQLRQELLYLPVQFPRLPVPPRRPKPVIKSYTYIKLLS